MRLLLIFVFSILVFQETTFAQSVQRGFVVSSDITAADIAILKSWKVNIVRYPLVWGDTQAADNSDATTFNAWLDASLAHFDNVLALFEAQGIKVVLNLHTPPGGFSTRGSRATHRIFTDAAHQETFMAAWEKIAGRYLGRSGIGSYDILNEPAQYSKPTLPLLDWNALAQRTAERIRVIDPTTPIMMGPVYGKLTRLKQMKPLTVSNVYYTVHFYDPWRYVHQGIYGVKLGQKYPTKNDNRDAFIKKLKPLYQFQKKHKTRVLIGEFSVARWAKNSPKYLTDLIAVFQKYKFDWAYHAFREADIWDLERPDDKNKTERTTKYTSRHKAVLKGLSKNQ
jgi:endoglucanase